MKDMTAANLRSAFGGESMAHLRYTVWASAAGKAGSPNVARLLTAVAHSERIHAWNHFSALRAAPGDFQVVAGAGFGMGSVAEILGGAAGGETFEIDEMYPAYITVAEAQGEERAVRTMHRAMEAEKVHNALFVRAKADVEAGGDARIGVIHVCDNCGWTLEGDAPDTCPICGAAKEMFIAFG
jgi:rubrerythrin